MIQTEKHECERKPEFVYISKFKIDGEWTEWRASFTASTRDGSATSNLHIKFCPFCGKELQ